MPVTLAAARIVTALVVAALALLALVAGIDTVRFEIARKTAADSGQSAALASWASRTGFKSPALEATLRLGESDLDALGTRRDFLTRLLAARPLAAQAWIMLAAVRYSLAMPPALVDKAFTMSGLTGPAEGDVMAQRALFGLLLWETSPAEVRKRTANDLCGLTVYDPSRLRLVLTTKGEAVRAAIRGDLVDHACAPRMIAAVGL